MGLVIYRYDAKIHDPITTVTMSADAEIMAVRQSDRVVGEGITIWAEVQTAKKELMENRFFFVAGTGNEWPEEIANMERNYLSTYQSINFGSVWHVYEIWPKR